MTVDRTTCLIALLVLFILPGCAINKKNHHNGHGQGLELKDTPFYPQKKYQCGPAALAMLLGASGVKVHPDVLAPHIYLPGRRGSLQLELIAASRQYDRIPYVIESDYSAIVDELWAGRPVLVLQNLGLNIMPAYHYAVVIGILPEDKIVLRSGTDNRLVMHVDHFLATWERSGSWGMIALRPGELPDRPDPLRYLNTVNSFETSGKVIQATEAYRAALSAWPENQEAMIALGNNYLIQSRYREAELLFRKLLIINPEHIAASNNLAEVFAQQECYSQALAEIIRAAKTAEKLSSPLKENVFQTLREISQKVENMHPDNDNTCVTQI